MPRLADKGHTAAERYLARRCPIMKELIQRVGPCTLQPQPAELFTTIVRCIIAQQISTRAANSIFERLAQSTKGPPITSQSLMAHSDDELANLGLSAPKRRTLRALITQLESQPDFLTDLKYRSDEDVHERLTVIKGIGPWTADMFLIFGLGRLDILPLGDLGFRVGIMKAFRLHRPPPPRRLLAIAEPWRPYRSIATWYLWRSQGPVPQSD